MTSSTLQDEKQLLHRIADGDETAFGELFHAHWEHIFSVAYSITRSVEQSEDIVQEIFIKVWTNREQLTTIEQFDSYLFILARNHIYNELKKAARQDKFINDLLPITEAGAGSTLTPAQELLLKESKQLIENAVAALPAQQQAVYRLSKDDGLKYDEIAEKLQLSKATVRNHMIRALRSVRQQLAGHHGSSALLILCLLITLPEGS